MGGGRAIAEFDPYFDIEIYDEGVNGDNPAVFMEGCVVVDVRDSPLHTSACKQSSKAARW